jgi:hypothetical protein
MASVLRPRQLACVERSHKRTSLGSQHAAEFTAGIGDPNGGTGATTIVNPTGSDLSVQQSVDAPGAFVYCFSAYVRSQNGVSISLFRQTSDASASNIYATQAAWNRISLSGSLNTAVDSTTVGIAVPAGQTGCTVSTQDSWQLRLISRVSGRGIIPMHFSQDAFTVTTTGPNRNHCTLTISAR